MRVQARRARQAGSGPLLLLRERTAGGEKALLVPAVQLLKPGDSPVTDGGSRDVVDDMPGTHYFAG